jgi:Domain of unknown function DUF29
LGIHEIKAVESNLVVVLKGPAQVPVPAGTSLPQLVVVDRGTPAPAAQRSRYQNEPAPLRPCALRECYQRGRGQALIEAGLAPDAVPDTSPYTLEQTLDPEFLPD